MELMGNLGALAALARALRRADEPDARAWIDDLRERRLDPINEEAVEEAAGLLERGRPGEAAAAVERALRAQGVEVRRSR